LIRGGRSPDSNRHSIVSSRTRGAARMNKDVLKMIPSVCKSRERWDLVSHP
jgi:hypothetical protein